MGKDRYVLPHAGSIGKTVDTLHEYIFIDLYIICICKEL